MYPKQIHQFFTSLIIFSLLTNVSFAQNFITTTINDSSDKLEQQLANGTAQKNNEEYYLEGSKAEGEKKVHFNNSIALFAASFTSIVLMKCKGKAASKQIYIGSSMLYIGSEIMGYANYKQGVDTVNTIDYRGNFDKQIEQYEKARDQNLQAEKFMKNKAKYAKFSGYGYAASAVMAIVEAASSKGTANLKCGGEKKEGEEGAEAGAEGEAAGEAAGETGADPGAGGADAGAFIFESIDFLDQSIELLANSKNNTDSYFLYKEFNRYNEGHYQSISINDYEKEKNILKELNLVSTEKNKEEELTNIFLSSLKSLRNFLIPMAHAEELKKQPSKYKKYTLVGLGAGAGTALLLTALAKDAMSGVAKALFEKPITRAMMGGAMAALAFSVSKGNKKAAKGFRKNADELEELIEEVKKLQMEKDLAASRGIAALPKIKSLPTVSKQNFSYCFKGSDSSIKADPNCSCIQTNNCKKAIVPESVNPADTNIKIPSSILSTVSSIGSAQNALNRGNTQGFNSLVNASLARKASALINDKNLLQDKLNDQRVKNGKSKFDFKKGEAKTLSAFKKIAANAIEKAGGYDKLQSKVATAAPNIQLNSEDKEKSLQILNKLSDVKGNPISNKKSKKSKSNDYLARLLKNKKGARFPANTKAKKSNLQDLKSLMEKQNSFDPNRNKDIFKIISVRYIKTAYPLLLTAE